VIRWRAAGIDFPIVGLLWSESVLSEVVIFLLIGPRLVRLLGPSGACALAAGAGVMRPARSAACGPYRVADRRAVEKLAHRG
jgi:PPP family 3-phenylpropionic acid transporter